MIRRWDPFYNGLVHWTRPVILQKKVNLENLMHMNIILQVWLVGDEFAEEDQLKAAKGTIFIPFTQLPPKLIRKDCFYRTTPALLAPISLKNLDSCEVSYICCFFIDFIG